MKERWWIRGGIYIPYLVNVLSARVEAVELHLHPGVEDLVLEPFVILSAQCRLGPADELKGNGCGERIEPEVGHFLSGDDGCSSLSFTCWNKKSLCALSRGAGVMDRVWCRGVRIRLLLAGRKGRDILSLLIFCCNTQTRQSAPLRRHFCKELRYLDTDIFWRTHPSADLNPKSPNWRDFDDDAQNNNYKSKTSNWYKWQLATDSTAEIAEEDRRRWETKAKFKPGCRRDAIVDRRCRLPKHRERANSFF